jgi:hypothetical protein
MKLRIPRLFICMMSFSVMMALADTACSAPKEEAAGRNDPAIAEGAPALNYGEIADFLAGRSISKESKLYAFTRTAST